MRCWIGMLFAASVMVSAQTTQTVQAPEPPQTATPTLRTSVNEVLLDFVVRDKHGQIVRNLRPGEVRVLEDGVPQRVRQFDFSSGRTDSRQPQAFQPPPALATAPQEPAASEPPTVNELRDISVVSIVIANLDPRGRKVAADAMRDFIRTEMNSSTWVGVFALGFGRLVPVQPYTNDPSRISAAVERIAGTAMLSQLNTTNQLSLPDTDFGAALNADAGTAADPNGPEGPTGAISTGAGGVAAILADTMDTQWVNSLHDVYGDSVNVLTPLRQFCEAQGNIPGRKVVLLFSAGLPVHPDTVALLRNVVSAANRANVSVYGVDTLGFTAESTMDNSRRTMQAAIDASRQQQLAIVNGGDPFVTPTEVMAMEMGDASIHSDTMGNMAELAEGTGGQMLSASLDMRDPLRRVMEDVRMHYEVAYSPANPDMDGRFRRIEVKVSRPGVHVFARAGYYAVPLLDGHAIYPFEIATLKALNTQPQLHQFAFHAAALQFRPGTDQTQLDFVFQVPFRDLTIDEDKQWEKVHVAVTALVTNDRGQVVQKISNDIPYELPIERKAELGGSVVSFTSPFQLPPGRYTLETAAVDRNSMKASVSRTALVVGDDPGFAMSDVALARRVDPVYGAINFQDPLEARGGKVTPDLSETVPREPAGTVRLYAVSYPPAPVDAPIDADVEIWRDGQLILRSPAKAVPPDQNGAASILASLPTTGLPPGHYEAQIAFQYKGQTVTKMIPFVLGGS
jgi:VWFA-related protein